MSDNIPFEIQDIIMKELPVKSLIQFRSVSKRWKSVIDSSEFITNYQHQHHQLLVTYADSEPNFARKYVSIVDDDTFPRQKTTHTVPDIVQHLHMQTLSYRTPIILGSSQGLFCLYNFLALPNAHHPVINVAVLWNPSIRKCVNVVVPNVSNAVPFKTVLGFGVCPGTNDPKLVKIKLVSDGLPDDVFPWEVEVFTLSSGVWRSPISINFPQNTIELIEVDNVVIDRFIYWHAYDMTVMEDDWYELIISFDLISEEFTEVHLPDRLSLISSQSQVALTISKLRDSLVVLQSNCNNHSILLKSGVWVMENGDPKSFTKIYNITSPDGLVRKVLGFRRSCEPIIEVIEDDHDAVSVCEPQNTNRIGFSGKEWSFSANCYLETLLLLDH